MATVKISPMFQVTIPSKLRKRLNLQPGQKMEVMVYQGRIELVPIFPVRSKRGFLKGIETDVLRERDRVY